MTSHFHIGNACIYFPLLCHILYLLNKKNYCILQGCFFLLCVYNEKLILSIHLLILQYIKKLTFKCHIGINHVFQCWTFYHFECAKYKLLSLQESICRCFDIFRIYSIFFPCKKNHYILHVLSALLNPYWV